MPFDALTSFTGGGGLSANSTATGTAGLRSGNNSFDSSGWNISFGSGSIDSTRGGEGISAYVPYVLAAIGLIVVLRMTRKSK